MYSVLGEIYNQQVLGSCLPLMPISSWNTTLIRINVIPSVVHNLGCWHVDAIDYRSCIPGICSTTMQIFVAIVYFLNILQYTMPNFAALVQFLNVL